MNRQIFVAAFLGALVLLFGNGCQTANTHEMEAVAVAKADQSNSEPMVVKEGDSLKISFPGAPNLDATVVVRRDGKITLPNGGEMDVVGKTSSELQKELADHYASQLVSKEVIVSIQSSSYVVYVTGAVTKPGKVYSDHPLSVLEAVMEAGGFEFSKANLKKVKVIRENPPENFTLDFKGFLDGHHTESFFLKPYDIIYVPEKFSWF